MLKRWGIATLTTVGFGVNKPFKYLFMVIVLIESIDY